MKAQMMSILLTVLFSASMVFAQGSGTADGIFVGTVYDSVSKAAVLGAKVVLTRYAVNPETVDSLTTIADGKFSFDSLLTGRRYSYTITVSKTGYANAVQTGLTLAAGQKDTVDFYMAPPGTTPPPPTAVGTFYGKVVDSLTRAALPNALVLLSNRINTTWEVVDSVLTNAGGVFRFDSVPASAAIRYSIGVSAATYLPESNTGLYADSGVIDTVNFDLVKSDTANSWLVYGVVTRDSLRGAPIAGAIVEVIQTSGTEYRYSAVTDNQGRWSVLVLEIARSYSVQASAANFTTKDSTYRVGGDSSRVDMFLVPAGASAQASPAVKAAAPLLALFPNPINPAGHIRYTVEKAVNVHIALYNVSGQELRVLVNARKDAGHYGVMFEKGALPAGTYMLKANIGDRLEVQKIIIQR